MSTNKQIDKKKTKHVRIDAGIHQLLKIEAAKSDRSIKSLLDSYVVEGLGVINEK